MKRIILAVIAIIWLTTVFVYMTQDNTYVYEKGTTVSKQTKDGIERRNQFRKTKIVYHFYNTAKPLSMLKHQIDTKDNHIHVLVNERSQESTYFPTPSVYVTASAELKEKNTQLPLNTYLDYNGNIDDYEKVLDAIDNMFNDKNIKAPSADYSNIYKPLLISILIVGLFLIALSNDTDIDTDINTNLNTATTVLLTTNMNNIINH